MPPIRRLKRVSNESGRLRTAWACNRCRERKVKCDGHLPICAQCGTDGLVTCVYTESNAVRKFREWQSAEQKIAAYRGLLQEISQGADAALADRITRVLQDYTVIKDEFHEKSSHPSPLSVFRQSNDTDSVGENLNRSAYSRATGYMGKISEVTWMRQLNTQVSTGERQTISSETQQYPVTVEPSTASSSYHLNNDQPCIIRATNTYALPAKAIADSLLNLFLEKVHTVLPVIREDLFVQQYHQCFSQSSKTPSGPWLAILNMVFAISSIFYQAAPDRQDTCDPEVFLSRAMILNRSEACGGLQQVQMETLLAFYFLSTSQINRSWKAIGAAARSGIAMGLNLVDSSPGLDLAATEARKRLWWSIFHLEHILTVMTGRVSCLGDGSSSVSPFMPFPVPECPASGGQYYGVQWSIHLHSEQIEAQQARLKHIEPSPVLYLFYLVDLCLIIHSITNQMYSSELFQEGHSRALRQIDLYNMMVDRWAAGLHCSMAYKDSHGNPLPGNLSGYQISLALYYHSAKILLNRPCLMAPTIDHETRKLPSRPQFSNDITSACRESLSLLSILPDQPDTLWTYHFTPWWILVHHMVQATSVLLTYLSAEHFRTVRRSPKLTNPDGSIAVVHSSKSVITAIKKAVLWLFTLGKSNEAARRAFLLCNNIYHRIVPEKSLGLGGMPSIEEFSYPHHYRDRHHCQDRKGSQGESSSLFPWEIQASEGISYPDLAWLPPADFNVVGDGALAHGPTQPQEFQKFLHNPCVVLDIDVKMPDINLR